MTVSLRFLCVDIPIGLGNGDISIDEGTTIEDILIFSREQYGIELPLTELKKSLFLVNSNPARLDYTLMDKDMLSIVRPLAGG